MLSGLENFSPEALCRILIYNKDKSLCLRVRDALLSCVKADNYSIYVTDDIEEANKIIKEFKPDCLISSQNIDVDFITAKLFFEQDLDFDKLKTLINNNSICRVIKTPYRAEDLYSTFLTAMQDLELLRSNSNLLSRVETRKNYLLSLKQQLELEGSIRVNDVLKKTKEFESINAEFELMNNVLSLLHGAIDISSIESGLKELLRTKLSIEDVKIVLDNKVDSTLTFDLICSGCNLGKIGFFKTTVFTRTEIDFLEKVSDAVAISVEKILRFSALEKIKKQWEAAFDSIGDPVVIIDEKYNIIRANMAFAKVAGCELKELGSRKCYDVLKKDVSGTPCKGCNIMKTFYTTTASGSRIVDHGLNRFYTTWSYPIFDNNRVVASVNFYKDISEQLTYKDRLVYSEKLAELGVLAGSVAHEINNPVGGIISLLQVILSEQSSNISFRADMQEMLNIAQRCKRIVDNLLHFSRTSKEEDIRSLTLYSIFDTLLPLIDIQLKNHDIEFVFNNYDKNVEVNVVFNELVQALLNIINNAVELISKKGVKGKIILNVTRSSNELCIQICDNGLDIGALCSNFGGVSLFVTDKIIIGFKGRTIFEHKDGLNVYKIYLPSVIQNEAHI